MRLTHWASAAMVIAAAGLGAYAVQLVSNPAERFDLTQTHKSIGLTVFALTVMRFCLRALTTAPKSEVSSPRLLRAARATHITLYALLLLLPLTGWLMAMTTVVRVPTAFFGLFELPYILPPDLPSYYLARSAHAAAAIVLAFLVAVHIAAAMVHALWWRDGTMARMWTSRQAGDPTDSYRGRSLSPSPWGASALLRWLSRTRWLSAHSPLSFVEAPMEKPNGQPR
jgi:cytochrome b561